MGKRFDTLFESDEPELIAYGHGTTDAQGVHRATRRLHRAHGALIRQPDRSRRQERGEVPTLKPRAARAR